jgi:hypothetical protein
VNTNAEEPAKRHVHIEDTPTHLLDQQPLDRADLPALMVEHSRALHTITPNHWMKLGSFLAERVVGGLPHKEAVLKYPG